MQARQWGREGCRMRKQMHQAIQRALKLAERPGAIAWLASSTHSAKRSGASRRAWQAQRADTLISLLNRQIADAQGRLRQLTDPGERRAQIQLIAELKKHLHLEMRPQGVCA